MVDFLYASDDNYAKVLGVSLLSLCIHNKDIINNIYVVSQNISIDNKEKLSSITNKYGIKIIFIEIDSFNKYFDKDIDIKRYSLSMFSRILADKLLPNDIKRIIYLDCDTLINDNLLDLYNINLNEKTIGAVNDYRSIYYQKNLDIKKNNCYINSGVLLIDLDKYRNNNYSKKIIDCIKKYNGIFEFPDNDAICKVLQDDIFLLPIKYNMISVFYMTNNKELKILRKPHIMDDDKIISISKKNPSIIHFTTMFLMNGRPWYLNCNHPYANRYKELYKLTPWGQEELPIFKKSFKKKIINLIIKITPRFILIRIVGLIHAYIKPFFQSYNYRKVR